MASLGLVSPGAENDGVTLFLLEKKLTIIFSHRPLEVMTFLAVVSSPRLSSVLSKFSLKINFIRVSLPWMVSPGAVRPP